MLDKNYIPRIAVWAATDAAKQALAELPVGHGMRAYCLDFEAAYADGDWLKMDMCIRDQFDEEGIFGHSSRRPSELRHGREIEDAIRIGEDFARSCVECHKERFE